MNIAFWLERTAQAAPDRPALFDGTTCVATYGAFHDSACRLAHWFVNQGVGPGDRVGLFMKNTPDYLIAQYAVWYAGAVVVPINAKLHPREAAWILENAGARLVVVTPGLADGLQNLALSQQMLVSETPVWFEALNLTAAVPVARLSDDLAWLFYTSGTTGRPKGVQITHRMLMTMSLCYHSDLEPVRADHATLYAAPLSHGAGIYNMVHVQAGARHIFPPSRGFDPLEILDLAAHHGRVHMFAAPTMVKRLTDDAIAAGRDGKGLNTIVYAGGPMYEADILAASAHFGPIFAQIYGQGECPMGITALTKGEVADRSDPRWKSRLNSVGRAQSAVEVAIADESGALLPVGDVGEILVRGDTVMPGYWQNPKASADTLKDGWLWTGDMGSLDSDGYLTLKDRSKDMIISGGSNIYPREVEDVLIAHPDVSEAAVIGRPHVEWGEEVVAFVVPKTGAALQAAELDAHCLAQIARFKRPKAYEFLTELPKNNYGKVLKTALRNFP